MVYVYSDRFLKAGSFPEPTSGGIVTFVNNVFDYRRREHTSPAPPYESVAPRRGDMAPQSSSRRKRIRVSRSDGLTEYMVAASQPSSPLPSPPLSRRRIWE